MIAFCGKLNQPEDCYYIQMKIQNKKRPVLAFKVANGTQV